MSSVLNNQVGRLARRVHATREARERTEAEQKLIDERWQMIAEAKSPVMYAFWCDHRKCGQDFDGPAWKQVRTNNGYGMAWYRTECPRGHVCIRRITDKAGDPYWWQSLRLKIERARYADDLMGPDDPRFQTRYPAAWAKLEAEREERETQQAYEHGILNL